MKKTIAWFLSAILLVFCFFGCSSSSSSAAPKSPAANQAAGQADQTAKSAADTSNQDANTVQSTSASTRKIVKNAKLTLETLKYEKCTSDFEALVAQYGGYVESSTIQGKGVNSVESSRTATYTARIPAEKLDAFLNAGSAIGNTTEKSISGQDVTQNYVDTSAKLKALKIEQDRLLDMMNKSKDMDTLLKIEARLTEVQNQLEQQTAELKNMDSLVGYATVTVVIQEKAILSKPVEPTLWGQIGNTLSASVNALGLTGRYLLVAVTALLPFAAVIGAVLVVVFLIRRKMKKQQPK